ncbi:MAG: hypothetical protein M3O36_17270, partial [Myxococcota bacterium]|nr:hypothetical protein [Myxococcota bacterium]
MAFGAGFCSFRAAAGSNVSGGLIGIALAAGCVARSPVPRGAPTEAESASLAGVSAEAPANRHPDGVAMDPVSALPADAERADARGVIALRQPPAGDAIAAVVLALVDGWQRESPEALGQLLSADAGPIDGRSRGRASLL